MGTTTLGVGSPDRYYTRLPDGHGEAPPAMATIAIMADSDNTGEAYRVQSDYMTISGSD